MKRIIPALIIFLTFVIFFSPISSAAAQSEKISQRIIDATNAGYSQEIKIYGLLNANSEDMIQNMLEKLLRDLYARLTFQMQPDKNQHMLNASLILKEQPYLDISVVHDDEMLGIRGDMTAERYISAPAQQFIPIIKRTFPEIIPIETSIFDAVIASEFSGEVFKGAVINLIAELSGNITAQPFVEINDEAVAYADKKRVLQPQEFADCVRGQWQNIISDEQSRIMLLKLLSPYGVSANDLENIYHLITPALLKNTRIEALYKNNVYIGFNINGDWGNALAYSHTENNISNSCFELKLLQLQQTSIETRIRYICSEKGGGMDEYSLLGDIVIENNHQTTSINISGNGASQRFDKGFDNTFDYYITFKNPNYDFSADIAQTAAFEYAADGDENNITGGIYWDIYAEWNEQEFIDLGLFVDYKSAPAIESPDLLNPEISCDVSTATDIEITNLRNEIETKSYAWLLRFSTMLSPELMQSLMDLTLPEALEKTSEPGH